MTESEKTVQGMHENRNKIFFFLVVVLEVGPDPHVC